MDFLNWVTQNAELVELLVLLGGCFLIGLLTLIMVIIH